MPPLKLNVPVVCVMAPVLVSVPLRAIDEVGDIWNLPALLNVPLIVPPCHVNPTPEKFRTAPVPLNPFNVPTRPVGEAEWLPDTLPATYRLPPVVAVIMLLLPLRDRMRLKVPPSDSIVPPLLSNGRS